MGDGLDILCGRLFQHVDVAVPAILPGILQQGEDCNEAELLRITFSLEHILSGKLNYIGRRGGFEGNGLEVRHNIGRCAPAFVVVSITTLLPSLEELDGWVALDTIPLGQRLRTKKR